MIDRRGRNSLPTRVWQRRARRIVLLVVLGMAALASLVKTTEPYFATNGGASSVPDGLFVDSQAPSDVLALGRTLGVTPTIDTVYADGSCFCTYSPPSTSMTLMLAVGALTTSQATTIGQALVAAGQSDAIIRVMWEQNQDVDGWFPNWNQLAFTAAQYISTFQNIVTTMRNVPGQTFRFMWNPNGGTGNEAPGRTWTDTWPGKAYVDLVGVDQYDYSGYAQNIQAIVAFAQSQGLPAALPEWGLNGSDDPSYINDVAALVNNPANDFALQAYFSYDGGSGGIDSDITQFPQSQAAYIVDFGGSSASLPPPTTATTAPSATTTTSTPQTTTPAPSAGSAPHVMVVMMENQGYDQIIGNAALPYIDSLATDYGSATKSFSYAHPSLPNYLALASGSDQGVTVDEDPSSSGIFNVPTLGSQLLGAGYSAKAYAENLPADASSDSGLYAVRHNPWEYFASSETLPVGNSTSLVSDLDGSSPPDFVWYTPNLTDDMHTGQPTDTETTELAGGETFLSGFIPSIQATPWYADGGKIIIEWDEALDSDTSGLNGGSGGQVPTIVVSAALKSNPQQSATPVDTVGVLHSIEDTYGLPHLGGDTADGNIEALLNPTASTTPPTTTPPTTTPPTTTPPTTTPPTTTPPTTTPPTTTPPTTTPPTTTPPTTTPPTTTPPTTTPPTTTPPTTPGPTAEATTTTVTVVPEVGTSVQGLTATVSPAPAGGTVQFIVDGWDVGDAVPLSSDGTAVMALYLANGTHLVDVTYSGSSAFGSSAATQVVGVGQATTSLLVADPNRIGPGQLYQLSATLTSTSGPVSGAAVWFSGVGSALCVATTDSTGIATCTIDEGSTDVFSLATAGVTAAYGGDSSHLPTTGQSSTHGLDHLQPIDTGMASGQRNATSAQAPVSPSSVAASNTPATFDAARASAARSGPGGVVLVVVGALSLSLVGVATLGRRRLLQAASRSGGHRWPRSR